MVVLTFILAGFLSARSLLPVFCKINQISFPHDLFCRLQSLQSISILLLNFIFTSKYSKLHTSPDLNALILQRWKFPWDYWFSSPNNLETSCFQQDFCPNPIGSTWLPQGLGAQDPTVVATVHMPGHAALELYTEGASRHRLRWPEVTSTLQREERFWGKSSLSAPLPTSFPALASPFIPKFHTLSLVTD